ncbi:uncharacterized protein LOC112155897 isoform X3 [Oryzias melastigma]|uniref:Uncharacterized LOC112155897 n=1 Tax=Oryzias melastigma TaxID=30732 RepID=A0A3B3DYK8_ORYME|nr:uncharacterized protein LOC112155897 isoform X3 [Oryzias melastigma]
MNMFRRGPTPADPSGISREETRTPSRPDRDAPEAETSVTSKVAPFPGSKAASSESLDYDSSQVFRTPSSESLDQKKASSSAQNPGVLRGALQKVNPFKSSAQVQKDASGEDSADPRGSEEDLSNKRNPGGITNVIQNVNPFRSYQSKDAACGQRTPDGEADETDVPVKEAANPGMLRGALQKVNPFKSSAQVQKDASGEDSADPRGSEEDLSNKRNPGGISNVIQKVNPFRSSQSKDAGCGQRLPDGEADETDVPVKEAANPGMLRGALQKVNPFKSSAQVQKDASGEDSADPRGSEEDLSNKRNSLGISNVIQKVNPFKSSQSKDAGCGQRTPEGEADETDVPVKEAANPGSLKGVIQKVNPFRSRTQVAETETDFAVPLDSPQDDPDVETEKMESSERVNDSSIERYSVWYVDADPSTPVQNKAPKKKKFIMKILPTSLFGLGAKNSTNAEDSQTLQQEAVEVQTLQLAEVPVPGDQTELDPLEDEEGLWAWWRTVEGWDEWNDSNPHEDEEAVEEAADRVFMAARLFVRLFNMHGASLQQRILELLALADSADNFHKRTVTASVGGGVASVAGSITTITGLILAPFTAGTSLIVTAVGIGIATAGGVTSASANITDTVHSKTDRKKVEKMIKDYEEEIKDIKECLEFLQEGMETLEEWNFEKYAESISKKHLNQNVKHVMKEGGRAGKALAINAESLISTVQVLSVAGGAAKAAQAISVTTGVMSGLFLALDVFFLAKDSMELKKGAKTEFATKIREVCKDLQDGLLELNRIKEQLQKTMDGIEVEVEVEDEEMLKSDMKKLTELEE